MADTEASSDDAEGPNNASPMSGKTKKLASIPRPTGKYNIQDAMGLGGSTKRRAKYYSILVCLPRRPCLELCLNHIRSSVWLRSSLGMHG